MKEFAGIFPALVTPYTKTGEVDYEQLKKLIDKLIADGVNGFYVTGSTGECFFLSDEERNNIVKTVVAYTNKRIKVIVHVGSMSTQHSISFAKQAQNVGADAISAVPPFYYKYNFAEIKNYYFDIMNSVDLPMIAYNFPALSGIELTVEHIKKLNEHKNFIGIKHTCKDLYLLEQFRTVNENLVLFSGHDEIYLSALPLNIDGAIGSTFNVMAPKFIKMTKLFKSGEHTKALKLQQEVNVIISAMIICGVQQSIKYILRTQGIECNGCRKPMREIADDHIKILDGILQYL